MDDLVAFLRARLDEDEAAFDQREHDSGQCDYLRGVHLEPERALAEVQAKRAILAEHPHVKAAFTALPETFGCRCCHYGGEGRGVQGFGWCKTLRALAAIYGSHPGYRPEWAPQPEHAS